jgi:hypothetical protein
LDVDSSSRLTTLTTDFHEFIGQVTQENQAVLQNGPFFQWDEKVRKDNPVPSGPLNPQALNRYSYVLNNPLRYVDPTGHDTLVFDLTFSPQGWEAFKDLVNGSIAELTLQGALVSSLGTVVVGGAAIVTAVPTGGTSFAMGATFETAMLAESGMPDAYLLQAAIKEMAIDADTAFYNNGKPGGVFTVRIKIIINGPDSDMDILISTPTSVKNGRAIWVPCKTAVCAARYFGADLENILANQSNLGVVPNFVSFNK